jgi:MFS family permease
MIRTAYQIDSPRAWQMAGVAFVVGFVVFGVLYSFGVFLEPLMTDLGTSRSATSALYAISSSAFYFLGPVTGWISDRWGPRLVSAVGAAAMTAGLGATALVDSVWIAYLTYGAHGLEGCDRSCRHT